MCDTIDIFCRSIKSIYFDGMKQVELAKKLGISKVRMSQKVSAILKKMRKMYEIG